MNILYQTKYLELRSAKSPDGSFDWVYAHRPNTNKKCADAVIIAAILHEQDTEKIILLETKRPAIYAEGKAQRCIEMPAGLVGDIRCEEDIISAAKTELTEETGYSSDNITVLLENASASAGCLSETVSYVKADIYDTNKISEPVSDSGVIVSRHIVDLKDVSTWLKQQQKLGKSISSQLLACLYLCILK